MLSKKTITISITLDTITYQEMEGIRNKLRMSRSAYIKQALLEKEARYNENLEILQWKG